MKGFLSSSLVIILSLTFNNLVPGSARRLQANLDIQSLCVRTHNPNLCMAKLRSGSTYDVEKDPKGAALFLIDEAKDNIRSTTSFLKKHIKTEKYKDVLGRLKGCLLGYDVVRESLEFDRASFDTLAGRTQALEVLRETDNEVSYDCGWQILTHFPPIVDQLGEMVANYSSCIGSASNIISSIH